jgi:hypothetical protein
MALCLLRTSLTYHSALVSILKLAQFVTFFTIEYEPQQSKHQDQSLPCTTILVLVVGPGISWQSDGSLLYQAARPC